MNLSLPPLTLFRIGVTEETAKHKCILTIGEMLLLVCIVPLASSWLKTIKHTFEISWDCIE